MASDLDMQSGSANRVMRLFHSRHRTTRRGSLANVLLLVGFLGLLGFSELAPLVDGAPETTVGERARRWVGELASPKFSIRQFATQHLIAQGVLVLPQVEAGLSSADREVRLRCQRIHRVIRENDFQARLVRFATDSGLNAHGLPKWKAFRKFVGDSTSARQLFVLMQQEQGSFLVEIQQRAKGIPPLIGRGLETLNGQRTGHRRKPPSLATLATLLLLVLDYQIADRDLNDALTLYLFRLDANLRESPVREPLLALLRHWLPRQEGPSTYMAMHISLRHGVAEARVLAERALSVGATSAEAQREKKNGRTYWRHLAVVVLARFGDDRHVAVLTPLLTDSTPTPYGRRQGAQRNVTQIRDIALAALVKLRKRKLDDFGFRDVRRHPEQVWDLGTLAFANDQARSRAIADWRRAEQAGNRPRRAP